LTIDIKDGFIGDLSAQMTAIRMDVSLIFHEIRLVLVSLRTQESEEMIKAFSRWPMIKRASIGRFFVGGHAILANRESVVAVVTKNFCNSPGRRRQSAIPARKSSGHNRVGKSRNVHGRAVAPSQQRGAGWGADRRGMEVRIAQTIGGESIECGRLNQATEGVCGAKAYVIQKNPHYVGSAGRRFHRFRPPFFGLGEGSPNGSLIWLCLLSTQCEFRTRCK